MGRTPKSDPRESFLDTGPGPSVLRAVLRVLDA